MTSRWRQVRPGGRRPDPPSRWHALLALLALAWLTVGCGPPYRDWTDDLSWAPDGQRGALLVGNDLYLIDAEGRPTPRVATDVYRMAWLPGSGRLVLARARNVATFAEVSAAIGPERTRAVVSDAEYLRLHLLQSPEWRIDLDRSPVLFFACTNDAVWVYLREHYGDALREKLGEDWGAVASRPVTLHSLAVAQVVDGERLDIGPPLDEFLTPIKSIRPSDDGRLIAFVRRGEALFEDDTVRLFVVPLDRSSPAALVAADTNAFPDWTLDGRALLYFQASGEDINIGSLGCLASREVIHEKGTVQTPEPARCLVDAIFDLDDRVRSVRDGRVLFSALPISFPRSKADEWRPTRLFAFNPAVVEAPAAPFWPDDVAAAGIGFFELNPDRTELLYGTGRGDIWRRKAASAAGEELPLGLHKNDGYVRRDVPLAIWSGPDAITYARPVESGLRFIRRRGDAETILDRDWPKGPPRPPSR